MATKGNPAGRFHLLRREYAGMTYRGYDYSVADQRMVIRFDFDLDDRFRFRPETEIIFPEPVNTAHLPEGLLDHAVFLLGLTELISYWKAACPPKIRILPHGLTEMQKSWWADLFYQGLGEFRYRNGIDVSQKEFVSIECESETLPFHSLPQALDRVMIPVGGGKDSAVTLNLLKTPDFIRVPFLINPGTPSSRIVERAGIPLRQSIVMMRKLDRQLLELNTRGFLNGHTPFSAIVAFGGLVASLAGRTGWMTLSNESSANEPTVPGTLINHQYSKSLHFEERFRNYISRYLTNGLVYFSFLRPLNELQIARLFSRMDHYHDVFISCNSGYRHNRWCGECPKCLFSWIILAPFLPQETLQGIFGSNLLDKSELRDIFDQLTGISEMKPFECVGTLDEVNVALCMTMERYDDSRYPALLKYYALTDACRRYRQVDPQRYLSGFDKNHFVPFPYLDILKNAIDEQV
ncbi:MAG: hypothetical protein JW861_03860 [Bacteroidales bacterium]|nr:hypothetical protein [Bacteroidales bacterium]